MKSRRSERGSRTTRVWRKHTAHTLSLTQSPTHTRLGATAAPRSSRVQPGRSHVTSHLPLRCAMPAITHSVGVGHQRDGFGEVHPPIWKLHQARRLREWGGGGSATGVLRQRVLVPRLLASTERGSTRTTERASDSWQPYEAERATPHLALQPGHSVRCAQLLVKRGASRELALHPKLAHHQDGSAPRSMRIRSRSSLVAAQTRVPRRMDLSLQHQHSSANLAYSMPNELPTLITIHGS